MSQNSSMVTISVLMGIYNCAETLSEAIESILNQTFTDWELIMCDDGSTDNTLEIAEAYAVKYPEKITVLNNPHNVGLNESLNKCLSIARGSYIARMDGDDICASNRFEEEIKVFQNEPEISIVSADMVHFDETGTWGREGHPTYPEKEDFLYGTPFCHAPCMVKKEAYVAVNGYSTESRFMRVEDYHLWLKMYKAGYKGRNIEQVLYSMRDDRNAYSRRKFRYRLNEAYIKRLAIKEFGLPVWGYIYVLRPIIVGLLPKGLYDKLHKKNLRG